MISSVEYMISMLQEAASSVNRGNYKNTYDKYTPCILVGNFISENFQNSFITKSYKLCICLAEKCSL